ncbi:MAG TPA: EAL domain-containing protein [Micropepsaceae bacterium]|nr:EAL domain-containing protein [Micropepsaceae bacterium]
MADWRKAAWFRGLALGFVSIALLAMTYLLVRASVQRAAMERKNAVAEERAEQLTIYQKQLEDTVALRTNELKDANIHLESELVERTAAENMLREHDALLNAVARSASELLGAASYGDAIAVVLELIAQTIMVGRVQLNSLKPDENGHLRSTVAHEWCAPNASITITNPAFRDLDVMLLFPKAITHILNGNVASSSVADVPKAYREIFEKAKMQSFLQVPVMVDNKLWGILSFIDSLQTQRKWSWAETDALKTLGDLIGAAIMRARFVKELADANMIVQNSPTILYRLRAEPSFPLAYISQNIVKFGHDPGDLLSPANWAETLVDSEDRAKVGLAMAQLLEKDSQGGTIEFRIHKGDGGIRWVEDRYTPVRDKLGRLTEVEGIIIDITERKAAEDKMALLARTDGLTGLANRSTFIERLRQTFSATRRGGSFFAILYMDIDHFKNVNDTLGHPIGDLLLKEVADRLKGCTRDNDLVARLGGDEFAVLQTEIAGASDAGELASRILHALSIPYTLNDNEVHITVSIGVCPYAADSASPDILLSQADLALYRAKDQGRNQYRFHSADLDKQVLTRIALSDELRAGIDHNELELHYQPQVEVISGKIAGVEALVRWNHPTRGLLQPEKFLPVAEQTGTIVALGHWVFDRACQQMRSWRDEGVAPPVITINLSLMQLKNSRDLIRDMTATSQKWGLALSEFEFDVTEATIAYLTWTQNDVLAQLHRLGAQIAIDNFGTEYSSFEYLRSYNVNHLKIARSLVATADTDPERAAMIRVMINMARELGIGIMAEGVETEEQRLLFLTSGASSKAQGFLFSRAVDASQAGELLRQQYIKPNAVESDAEPDQREGTASKKVAVRVL